MGFLERANERNPRLDTLMTIPEGFGITVSELLQGIEKRGQSAQRPTPTVTWPSTFIGTELHCIRSTVSPPLTTLKDWVFVRPCSSFIFTAMITHVTRPIANESFLAVLCADDDGSVAAGDEDAPM